MLGAKEAVKVSLITFAELFSGNSYDDLRLEEVAQGQDRKNWSVTLSFKNPDLDEQLRIKKLELGAAAAMLGVKGSDLPTRQYKSVVIDAIDGSLVQIKSA